MVGAMYRREPGVAGCLGQCHLSERRPRRDQRYFHEAWLIMKAVAIALVLILAGLATSQMGSSREDARRLGAL